MIIQKITGGLGNQMFQYAYIKALSKKNNIDFKLDISEYQKYFRPYELEVFNIEKKYSLGKEIPFYENLIFNNRYLNFIFIKIRSFLKKINKNHHNEKQFNFNQSFLDIKSGYIEGYFQTEKYFKEIEKEIRNDFTFAIPPSKKNQETGENIRLENSVSLHIRRGDYITNSKANAFHGSCSLDYYKNAIQHINNKIDNLVFYIFSDDIKWVKENLIIENKAIYVDWNTGKRSYEDMRLMSLCKHNIIANSSFSWWGAWLNQNKNKIVLAPKKWFNSDKVNTQDIIPKTWQKI